MQGCRVHYELIRQAQNPDAPIILFLHGWGCDHSIFAAMMESCAEQATILSLDFPGHGKSDDPPEPWDVSDYAEMVFALLNELFLSPVNIVAHSFGARVAILLSSQYPELVSQMIITGGAGLRKEPSPQQQKRTKQYKQYNQLLSAVGRLPGMKSIVEDWQQKLRNRYGSADYAKLNEVMRKSFVKIISEDLTPRLKDIKASSLLIWGSEDTETPLWMGQEMEKQIPDAGLVVFENRGHFAFVEEWQRFALIMKQFLVKEKS